MQDYLRMGVMEALAAVKDRSKSRVHTMGYCLGGTFAIVAASLGRKSRGTGQPRNNQRRSQDSARYARVGPARYAAGSVTGLQRAGRNGCVY